MNPPADMLAALSALHGSAPLKFGCIAFSALDFYCIAFFKARPKEGNERTMVSFGTVKDIRI
jgi:hypothetical protein